MKKALSTIILVGVGMITVNYWVTAKFGFRDPMIGCWEILDPFLGFCF